MNLELLNDGTPTQKQWLNPVVYNLTANTVTANEFIGPDDSPTVTLVNQGVAPAAPAAGSTVLYSNSSSNLQTKNSASVVNSYVSNTAGSSVVNDIAVFSSTDGSKVSDGGFGLKNLLRNQATMVPVGGPTLTNSDAFATLIGPVVGAGLTIPANQLTFGSSIKFTACWNIASSIALSELTMVASLNGTSIDNTLLVLGVQTNINYRWDFEWVYSSANSARTKGVLYSDIAAPLLTNGSTFAFDPTIPCVIDFGAQWNTADPGNSVQLDTYFVTRNF